MASASNPKKNMILLSVAAVLLLGALFFGLKDMIFAPAPATENIEAATANDEVVNRITGGKPATAEPDPPGPAPEPGSGRRAHMPQK
jgi:hypothetical protein